MNVVVEVGRLTSDVELKQTGNAVCLAVAEALVRANLPQYCKRKISDMAQLHEVMISWGGTL